MGMDVSGRNPANKAGKYFCNNCWAWRPLWDYCHAIAPDLIDDTMHQSGHYNDGAGLDAAGATALAERLQQTIDQGDCEKFMATRAASIASMPEVECDICKGAGKRIVSRQAYDNSFSMTIPALCEDDAIVVQCGACNGNGHRADPASWYGFTVANVQEFATFLEASGGFCID